MDSNMPNEPPHAIVMGLDNITGLQTARIYLNAAFP